MPTLNWIGKEAVVKHHKEVPFRLLEPVAELSLPSPAGGGGVGGEGDFGGNLIVQSDNQHALKALLPRYAGRVKCIYAEAGGIGLFVDALDEQAAGSYQNFGFAAAPDNPLLLFLSARKPLSF